MFIVRPICECPRFPSCLAAGPRPPRAPSRTIDASHATCADESPRTPAVERLPTDTDPPAWTSPSTNLMQNTNQFANDHVVNLATHVADLDIRAPHATGRIA